MTDTEKRERQAYLSDACVAIDRIRGGPLDRGDVATLIDRMDSLLQAIGENRLIFTD